MDANLNYRDPAELLSDLGVTEPRDIQLEGIAQFCRATILYEPLQGSEARLIGFGSRAIITVNSRGALPRRRFSAAHELGHWMWDRGTMAFQCAENGAGEEPEGDAKQESEKESIERRANRYAVDLLLPQTMLRTRWNDQPMKFSEIQKVALEFKTSLSATAIRLIELSHRPLVLRYQDKKRKWSAKSPAAKEILDCQDWEPESEIVDRRNGLTIHRLL